MQVMPSFPFDEELRRIALAQALRGLRPTQVWDGVARLFAYAAAGLCPVAEPDDRDALRRHGARLAAEAWAHDLTASRHPVPARNT